TSEPGWLRGAYRPPACGGSPRRSRVTSEPGWLRGAYLVSCPLDGVEGDAFLNHLPQGGHVAQALDVLLQELDHVVERGLGREPTDGHAEARVRQLVVEAHRPQHIARFEARRRAGGAGRERDILEGHEQRLAFDVGEADVEVAG